MVSIIKSFISNGLYLIAVGVAYYFFGPVVAAAVLIGLLTLKIIVSTFNLRVNSEAKIIKIPYLGNWYKRLIESNDTESLAARFDHWFHKSTDTLLRGDLEAYAKERWPKEKHAELWMEIPDDIRRPIIFDGRLPDGSAPADTLCATAIDDKFIANSFRQAVIAALVTFAITFIFWRPDIYIAAPIKALYPLVQTESQSVNGVPVLRADAWTKEEAAALMSEKDSVAGTAATFRSQILYWLVASHGTLTAFAMAFLVFIVHWRSSIALAVSRRGKRVSLIGAKEGITRWKRRLEDNNNVATANFNRAKLLNDFDRTPTILIGHGTGTLEFRGSLRGIQAQQEVRLSLRDLCHTLVLGGTGSGKTLFTLRNILAQLLDLMKGGYPLGIYGTDGKGTIWRMIKSMAEANGLGDKVIIIGTEDNQYGVDLCGGLEPSEVGDTVTSVLAQLEKSAGGGDSYWRNMGNQLMKNAATVARAWEMTVPGKALVMETGIRLYSLSTIKKLAINQKYCDQAIVDLRSSDLASNPYATNDLFEAMEYMSEYIAEMAKDTASGIRSNVMNALGNFTFNLDLDRQFSSGSADNEIKLSDCIGKIVLINIPESSGMAGRLVNIMLKTLFMKAELARQVSNPGIGDREQVVFIADEYQELVTAGSGSLNDGTFWNMSRPGCIGIFASQTLSTMNQAIGEDAMSNFKDQMRNRITLRNEDDQTISEHIKLAGKSWRWNVTRTDHFETWSAYRRELGPEKSTFKPVDFEQLVPIGALERFGIKEIGTNFGFDPGFEVDDRFWGKKTGRGPQTQIDLGEEERAYWRRDDKVDAYMSSMEEHDILVEADLIHMGIGQAYVSIQRGNTARHDIIQLPMI